MHLFPGSTGMNARVETRSEPLHPKPRTTLQEECGEEVIRAALRRVFGYQFFAGYPGEEKYALCSAELVPLSL